MYQNLASKRKKKRQKQKCKIWCLCYKRESQFVLSSYSQHNDKPITSSEIFIIGDQVCFHKTDTQSFLHYSLRVKKFLVRADDLMQLKECGRGAYGVVYAMKHRETGTIMAVKVYYTVLPLVLQMCGIYFYPCKYRVNWIVNSLLYY